MPVVVVVVLVSATLALVILLISQSQLVIRLKQSRRRLTMLLRIDCHLVVATQTLKVGALEVVEAAPC